MYKRHEILLFFLLGTQVTFAGNYMKWLAKLAFTGIAVTSIGIGFNMELFPKVFRHYKKYTENSKLLRTDANKYYKAYEASYHNFKVALAWTIISSAITTYSVFKIWKSFAEENND